MPLPAQARPGRGRRRHRLAHRRPRLLRADRGPYPGPRRPCRTGLRRGGRPTGRGTPPSVPRPQGHHPGASRQAIYRRLRHGPHRSPPPTRRATVFDAGRPTISGVKLKIRFLRVNERHHSIAVAATRGLPIDPIRTRVQHLNIQAATLDDVAQSYQRVHELGFDMALSVGQHTNDKELSYYARTPSGFEWEVGWNPIVIDETTWEPSTHQGISVWGHLPVGRTIVDKLAQFRAGARSLAHPEDTVPALSGAGITDD
nr:VOC family protein [Streptomyces sp. CB04723]